MISSTTLDSDYGNGLTLSPTDTANLRKAGKWGRFLGIVSMVFCALAILLIIGFGGTMFASLAILSPELGAGGGAVTALIVFYVAILAFSFYITFLLYKFGSEAVAAVDSGDAAAMTRSFASLARLLKIYGIITIVYLGFFGLTFLLGLVGGGLALFGGGY